jgi:hypothetical protein
MEEVPTKNTNIRYIYLCKTVQDIFMNTNGERDVVINIITLRKVVTGE